MLRRAAVLLALLLPLTVFAATPATAGTESEFTARANGARAARSLRAYAVRSDLTAVARRQAARMAAARRIYHNPSLTSEVRGWRNVGENVGRGYSVASIHDAFMASYSHRANILSTTYTEIGVGTARSGDGEIFVSQVFRRPYGAVTYTPPAPRRTAAPVYRAPVRRASRSGVRRPLAVTRPPARKRVVVDRAPARLRYAAFLHRKSGPDSSMERVIVFVRVNKALAG